MLCRAVWSTGMNDKGLHIGALMQDNSTGINRYNTAAEPYPAVEQVVSRV